METGFSISYVSIDDTSKASSLAHLLVNKRLAACVQVIPKITSVYRWEGKVTEDNELLLMIKSRTSRLKELTDVIVANHPYKICEVVSVPIQHGNPAYLDWVANQVEEKNPS